jgi:hypothetical protein
MARYWAFPGFPISRANFRHIGGTGSASAWWYGCRPPDQITPGTESRLVDALRRYCRAKIADNALEIRLIRVRNTVGLGITAAIVIGIIALAYGLFSGVLADAPMAAQYLVAGAISLFSWVVLWDVLEALIFDPIPLLRENSALRKISSLEIVVEPGRACEGLPGMGH